MKVLVQLALTWSLGLLGPVAHAAAPDPSFEFIKNGWGMVTPVVRHLTHWYQLDRQLNFTPISEPSSRWSVVVGNEDCTVGADFEVKCPSRSLGFIPKDTIEFERYALRTQTGRISALRTDGPEGETTTRYAEVDLSGIDGTVVKLTGSEAHACALTSTGKIYCWGENQAGRLGIGGNPFVQLPENDGDWSVVSATPAIAFPTQPVAAETPVRFADVATRGRTTCALSHEASHNVYCWGRLVPLGGTETDYKQISRTTAAAPRRLPLEGVSGKRMEGIAVEVLLGMGWTSDNSIYVWGSDQTTETPSQSTLDLEPRFIDRLPANLKIRQLIPLARNLCAVVETETKTQELYCTRGGKRLERRLPEGP